MSDMLKVIEPKSDQINAEDLLGRDLTITVRNVVVRAGTEQPVSIQFDGSDKVFRPCKTVSRILVAAWGPDTSIYPGRSLTLYRDPKVKWGGMEVGGIRVRAMSHIEAPLKLALAESKKNRTITVVQPLKIETRTEPASQGKQTAEQWATDHIGFVNGAADIARLDAVIASGTKAMAKLETANATLHKSVSDAYAKRRAELTDDDDPFAQGRTDEQHGDQFDGTSTDIADKLIGRVQAATDSAAIDAIEAEYQQAGRAMIEVPDQDRVEAAIDAARAAVKGQGK